MASPKSSAASPAADDPQGAGSTRERFTISAAAYRRIVFVALALLCIIVLTGAAVRLTGSGLGCSDWPNCEKGKLVSVADSHQAIEQLNRLFTGAVSVGVVAAVLGALRRRPYDRSLVHLAWGLVAGVVAQIVLGGISVLTDLNPVVVAGHFGLSMVLVLNATVLLFRSADRGPAALDRTAAPVRWLSWVVCAAGALVVVVTGPMVTGSGPHAGDETAERIGMAIPTAARIHSLSAWLFLALLLGLVFALFQRGAGATMRSAYPLFVVILIQGAIGYTQYELGIPAWLVILHIAGATAVTVALTWFQLRLLHLTSAIPTGNRAGSGRGGLEAPGAAEPGDPEHAGATAP